MIIDPNHKSHRQDEREDEIANLKIAIQSKNPRVRTEAARRLGQLQAGSEVLLEALEDPSSFVRSAAAESLGNLPPETTLPEIAKSLLAAIDDPNDHVCSAAISSLGRLHLEAARDQILACLEDPNPYVISAAITALSRIGPMEMGERIIPFLDNPNKFIRNSAVRAMGTLRYQPAGPRLVKELEELCAPNTLVRNTVILSSYIDSLVALKIKECIPLLVMLAQNEVGVRSKAVEGLLALDAIEAAPTLLHLFSDPSEKLRKNLVRMIIASNYQAALPVLRPLLNDSNAGIRRVVLAAVVRMHDLPSASQIRSMAFSDTDPLLRSSAVNGLADLLGVEAIDDIIRLTEDTNPYVRLAAAKNLGKLPSSTHQAVKALQMLAEDPINEIQEAAKQSLEYVSPLLEGLPEASCESIQPVHYPSEFAHRLPELLRILQDWRSSLPQQYNHHAPQDLWKLDQALSLLILTLEQDGVCERTGTSQEKKE